MLIGIVGKPSAGKSTFLNAACMTDAKVGNYPFTTLEPNPGSGYVKVDCVCQELNVEDNPKNSVCIKGNRYVPVKLLDVAGLVPDAHKGRGLGHKFFSDLIHADVLIHVVDISGELDLDGNEIEGGGQDPIEDVKFLIKEIDLWFRDILLRKEWVKFANKITMDKLNFADELYERVSGLSITKMDIVNALEQSKLDSSKPDHWTEEDITKFSSILRAISKPFLIVANKIDKKSSESNYKRLQEQINEKIIPASSLAELVLRKYEEKGLIEYSPGESFFRIIDESKLGNKDKMTLENINEKILKKYGTTGIQDSLNYAIFNVLNGIIVYPVNDERKYSDKDGNILPDAYIVPNQMNIKEFVKDKIHSDLAKNFLYAIDARTKMKLGKDYKLKNNDIIKVVSAAKSK